MSKQSPEQELIDLGDVFGIRWSVLVGAVVLVLFAVSVGVLASRSEESPAVAARQPKPQASTRDHAASPAGSANLVSERHRVSSSGRDGYESNTVAYREEQGFPSNDEAPGSSAANVLKPRQRRDYVKGREITDSGTSHGTVPARGQSSPNDSVPARGQSSPSDIARGGGGVSGFQSGAASTSSASATPAAPATGTRSSGEMGRDVGQDSQSAAAVPASLPPAGELANAEQLPLTLSGEPPPSPPGGASAPPPPPATGGASAPPAGSSTPSPPAAESSLSPPPAPEQTQ